MATAQVQDNLSKSWDVGSLKALTANEYNLVYLMNMIAHWDIRSIHNPYWIIKSYWNSAVTMTA